MTEFVGLLILAIAVVLFLLVIRILKRPLKLAFKILLHALSGYITLFIVNLIGGIVGIAIPVTWISAIVVGFLGIPGVVLMLILQYMG